jgi:hypothetical protein
MLHSELGASMAREQYQDQRRRAAQRQLAGQASRARLPLLRRVARPLGHLLLRLGTGLLHYGRAESPLLTQPYRPSVRSIELN